MICNKIRIRDFRNIEEAEVGFSPGVNVFCGDNAQGKTNLLEAVYTATGMRSFRETKDAELVRFGCENAGVELDFTDGRPEKISIRFVPGRRRQIEINKNKITRLCDIAGRFRCVLFCPEHLAIVKGAPAVRREFLDEAIVSLRPMYLVSLTKYERILKERNTLLKNAAQDRATFEKTVDFWSEQLAHEAAILSRFRESYIGKIADVMKEYFRQMSEKTGAKNEVPDLVYLGSSGQNDYSDLDRTKETYLNLLRNNLEREIGAGSTLYGIHRDDVEITLGGKPARFYASQGQQRSLALALKLAEGEIIRAESGEYPVFLLDDVLSELDSARRAYLVDEIRDKQVIMTTCEIGGIEDYRNAKIVKVKDGKFEEIPGGSDSGI